MGKSTYRQVVKRAAASVGLELTTRRGSEIREQTILDIIEEYLNLFSKHVGVKLPTSPDRITLLRKLVGVRVGEGAHLVACINETLKVPGDVCECGVGSGATSALFANELRESGKRLWLFDTFSGLPPPSAEDRLIDDIDNLGSIEAYVGKMSHPRNEVEARLKSIGIPNSQYCLVPGLFEQSVDAGLLPERVSFAYIDFDFYAPIKCALEQISRRLSPGGIMVVDDYGFFSEGAQVAVDGFIAASGGRFTIDVPDYCHDHFAIVRQVPGSGSS